MQANAAAANGGPLTPDALRRLFERIIDETRSLERALAGDADGPAAPLPPAASPPPA